MGGDKGGVDLHFKISVPLRLSIRHVQSMVGSIFMFFKFLLFAAECVIPVDEAVEEGWTVRPGISISKTEVLWICGVGIPLVAFCAHTCRECAVSGEVNFGPTPQ